MIRGMTEHTLFSLRSTFHSADLRTMRVLLSNFYDMLGVAMRTLETFKADE